MGEGPELSVIVAVRNQAAQLPPMLAHLEGQSLAAARYEIVAVDCASTDETPRLLESYAAAAPVPTRWLRVETPGIAHARNRALEAARGRWALFLDSDLLAGPYLLERHLEALVEGGGGRVTLGAVALHPQFNPHAVTRWFLPEEQSHFDSDGPVDCLDWRAHNMGIAAEALREAGGFDEAFVFPYFGDIELALRLAERPLTGHYVSGAVAYIWRPSTFEHERQRQYGKGYSLHTLSRKSAAPKLFERYPVRRSVLLRGYDRIVMPMYIRASRHVREDTRLYGYFYRRILRYELYRGFEDARRGRPPGGALLELQG